MTHAERNERRAALIAKLAAGEDVLKVATEFGMAPEYVRRLAYAKPSKVRPRKKGKYVPTMTHVARAERRAEVKKFLDDGGYAVDAKAKFGVSDSYIHRLREDVRPIRGNTLQIYADLRNNMAAQAVAWKYKTSLSRVRQIEALAKSLEIL